MVTVLTELSLLVILFEKKDATPCKCTLVLNTPLEKMFRNQLRCLENLVELCLPTRENFQNLNHSEYPISLY